MRIPLPIVILLALAVIGVVWWHGTKDYNFLETEAAPLPTATPVESPIAKHAMDLPRVPEGPAPTREPAPAPDLPEPPPGLDLYRDAPDTAASEWIARIASHEAAGDIPRALLAAERLIDSSAAEDEPLRQAVAAVLRLRPQLAASDLRPADTFPIVLKAAAGESTAVLLEPLLREIAAEIETASAGILEVRTLVSRGRNVPQAVGAPRIALSLCGPANGGPSTEVLVFPALTTEGLHDDLVSSLLVLLRNHIGRTRGLRVPETQAAGSGIASRLHSHVSRLVWLELGKALNAAH